MTVKQRVCFNQDTQERQQKHALECHIKDSAMSSSSSEEVSITESLRRLRARGGQPYIQCDHPFWAIVIGSYWWMDTPEETVRSWRLLQSRKF